MTDWDHARLADVARRHGTPVHVFDAQRLDDAVARLHEALGALDRPTRVYYSVKTNYLPALCRRLARAGQGADVVSGYEMEAALAAGFPPADMVFNGPMKTPDELARAHALGIAVNIDAAEEVDALAAIADGARPAAVGIRISPGLPVSTSVDPSYRAQTAGAARRNRFGWPAGSPQLADLLDRIAARPQLRLTAVHAHLSSQIVHDDLFGQALDVVFAAAAGLRDRFDIQEVNIGGGFGVPGIVRPRTGPLSALWAASGGPVPADPEPRLDLAAFLTTVDKQMRAHGLADTTLGCEPGRWLVSDTMALLTSVVTAKHLPDARWLILDAGNNVAPWSGTGERHRLVPLGRVHTERTSSWSVAGPLCYENDIHGTDVDLPADLRAGDLLCLHDTGAYSLGRSNNFIRTRAAVVEIDGDRERLVWRRESYADVFRFATDLEQADPVP
ncbi:diaminopimelate decarboxylase family protein [Micromonospora sp. BQ11]|uniref:diaminopimelate decarboxylase family protein n=1 Tax=Micromonospora sp. BQ11 TaxID=3452212 RepID=UPI003F8CB365